MRTEIIAAGFGGQGVLTLGVIIASAAVKDNLNTTWVPSYGPEMRGGTANCHVIVSDKEIGSAIVNEPDIVFALNLPSMQKFEMRLKKDGLLIVNSSLIAGSPVRKDIRVLKVPLSDLARENPKALNMAALGILLSQKEVVSIKSVKEVIKEKFAVAYDSNIMILTRGMEFESASCKARA